MATVRLVNTAPCNSRRDEEGELVREPIEGLETSITTSEVVPGVKFTRAVAEIADAYKYHSFDPPEAVWSDQPALAHAVADELSTEDHEVQVLENDPQVAEGGEE
jgi:hypothetical protein